MLPPAQQYALGLLTEECGEVLQTVGKAARFGLETPGVRDPYTGVVDTSITPRTALQKELGDVLAAIAYASECELVDLTVIKTRAKMKFEKLMSENSVDNLGKRLAPNVYENQTRKMLWLAIPVSGDSSSYDYDIVRSSREEAIAAAEEVWYAKFDARPIEYYV